MTADQGFLGERLLAQILQLHDASLQVLDGVILGGPLCTLLHWDPSLLFHGLGHHGCCWVSLLVLGVGGNHDRLE